MANHRYPFIGSRHHLLDPNLIQFPGISTQEELPATQADITRLEAEIADVKSLLKFLIRRSPTTTEDDYWDEPAP